jgi:hypothetical protein
LLKSFVGVKTYEAFLLLGIAQSGSAFALEAQGRWFESSCSDREDMPCNSLGRVPSCDDG